MQGILKKSAILFLSATSGMAMASPELPFILSFQPDRLRRGIEVSVEASDSTGSEFILTYAPTGSKDPAQTGPISGKISKETAQVLFEILEISKPTFGKWASDTNCVDRTQWRIRSGSSRYIICEKKEILKSLEQFVASASEILRPE
jgi:hypothetical protein